VTALTTLLLVAGCAGGGAESGKPAAQILRDAQAAAQAADSVHITGTVARGTDTAHIDLVLASSGDGREQITGAGQNIDLIKVGQTLYLKGLAAPGAAAGYQRLSTQSRQAMPLAAQLDKNAVFAQLIKAGDAPSIIGTDTIAGQPAVKLAPSAGAGVLYVADDAAHPYPLEVQTSTPAGATTGTAAAGPSGGLMFTDWNAHAVISPPPSIGN